jgi:hypothetical protein
MFKLLAIPSKTDHSPKMEYFWTKTEFFEIPYFNIVSWSCLLLKICTCKFFDADLMFSFILLQSNPGQYFIGEVLVNNQWTDQYSNGTSGAPFNMEYMCSVETCATSMVDCLPNGKYGALTTNGHGTSWSGLCMGTFGQGGNPANGPGMYYICEYGEYCFIIGRKY